MGNVVNLTKDADSQEEDLEKPHQQQDDKTCPTEKPARLAIPDGPGLVTEEKSKKGPGLVAAKSSISQAGASPQPVSDTSANLRHQRTEADWAAIKEDIRSGMSYGQCAKVHGVPKQTIYYRARRDGWTADLASKVAAETRRKILSGSSDTPLARGDDDDDAIVDRASRRAFSVNADHQTAALKLRNRLKVLLSVAPTAEQLRDDKVRKVQSEILRNASQAMDRLTTIERRAWGIDGIEDRAKKPHIKID